MGWFFKNYATFEQLPLDSRQRWRNASMKLATEAAWLTWMPTKESAAEFLTHRRVSAVGPTFTLLVPRKKKHFYIEVMRKLEVPLDDDQMEKVFEYIDRNKAGQGFWCHFWAENSNFSGWQAELWWVYQIGDAGLVAPGLWIFFSTMIWLKSKE